MINCREFADFIAAYVDGELSPDQRALFDEHIRLCPPCLVYLETYAETICLEKAALGGPEEGVPAEVPEELVRAVLAAMRPRI